MAVTNDIAYLNQEIQYYPFGTTRVSEQYGPLNQSNKYIGQNLDDETDLSYLNARYYDSGRGQFLSQDPVFWEIGQTSDGLRILKEPQLANSYSYAGNNPITQKDPSGRIAPLLAAIFTVIEYYSYANAAVDVYNYANVLMYPEGYSSTDIDDTENRMLKNIVGAGTGFLGGPMIEAGMNTVDAVLDTSIYVGGKARNVLNTIITAPLKVM